MKIIVYVKIEYYTRFRIACLFVTIIFENHEGLIFTYINPSRFSAKNREGLIINPSRFSKSVGRPEKFFTDSTVSNRSKNIQECNNPAWFL